MGIHDLLFKLKVTTFVTDILTDLQADNQFQIGKILQTDIGFIYGMSTYADGLCQDGSTLISTTQAQGIFLTLKNGSTEFLQTLRMSDLLNEFAGSPVVRPEKYMPVNIQAFDLSKSFYQNPNLFAPAAAPGTTIQLKLWFIKKSDWNRIKVEFFKMKK